MSTKYNKSPNISNSMLGWFEQSPQYFKENYDKREEKYSGSEASYYEFGDLLHKYILTPNHFVLETVEKPSPMIDRFIKEYVKALTEIEEAALLEEGEKIFPIDRNASNETKSNVAAERAHKESEYSYTLGHAKDKLKEFKKYIERLIDCYNDPRKVLISSEDFNKIKSCKTNIINDPRAEMLLLDDFTGDGIFNLEEIEIYWKYSWKEEKVKNSIELKSKIDKLQLFVDIQRDELTNEIININISTRITDLKSTSENVFSKLIKEDGTEDRINWRYSGFINKFKQYKYYRQLAFYADAVEYALNNQSVIVDKICNAHGLTTKEYLSAKRTIDSINCYIVSVCSSKPHNCATYNFDPYWYKLGKTEYEALLRELHWHLTKDFWNCPKSYHEDQILLF